MHNSEGHPGYDEVRRQWLRRFDWWRSESPRQRAAVRAAAKMAARGLAVPVTTYSWQAVGRPYCDDPVPLLISGHGKDAGAPVTLSMFGPCRKCPKCLLFRQMKWQERISNELIITHNAGRRSWWITLTFSPVHLAGVLAESAARRVSVDQAAYKHVQGYLDRLRKAAKTRLRYMAVFERGETTGRSHYHLIIHEVGPKPILKAQIEGRWRSHVHARVVDLDRRGLAAYLTKYATKSAETRIRASTAYGRGGSGPARRSGHVGGVCKPLPVR